MKSIMYERKRAIMFLPSIKLVQSSAQIKHFIVYITAVTWAESDVELTKDITYVALTGKLLGVFLWGFRRKLNTL